MNAPAAHWDILKQDLRYTARTLNRARGFALTAILVTALGVGANTAAFSVADFVLLRPLPFPDPDTLVRLCEGPRTGGGWGCMNQLSPANYRDLKAMSSSFDDMGAFADDAVNLVGGGEPRRLAITPVTPEVLPLLGVKPALGRVFEPGDRGRQRRRHQPRPVAIAVRRRPRGAGPDDQPQRGALHDHRRHAADVLLSQPRQADVDGADVPRGGLRQSHEQLHRGGGPPQAGRHVRTGPGGTRVAGRAPGARLPARPTRRPASASTACGTTCRRASA